MLKISEFAKLANTTRRTLIFYDEKNIFKPAQITEKGYRFYEPDQLYQFEMIRGMSRMGLSLEEIQRVLTEERPEILEGYLTQYQVKLREDIRHLEMVCQLLENKLSYVSGYRQMKLGQISIVTEIEKEFWCSDREVDCEPEDIARFYAQFMEELGDYVKYSPSQTGFLTELNLTDGQNYMSAAFRFIKGVVGLQPQEVLTKIVKPTGDYLIVKVANTLEGILAGLAQLKDYAEREGLVVTDKLWQLNADEEMIHNASSRYGILAYQIIERRKG